MNNPKVGIDMDFDYELYNRDIPYPPANKPPSKISPLPSLTFKFLHRYVCLDYKPPSHQVDRLHIYTYEPVKMLLLSSKDVHTQNNKSFSHRRSSCCRLLDRSSRCRSFGEKTSKLWIFPAVRDQRWWLRGAYIRGKVHIENKPPPQSRSCLLLKKRGGGLFSGGYGNIIQRLGQPQKKQQCRVL